MKLIIPVHSTVDLITNSSSELFICSQNKSVEAVTDLLVELWKQAVNSGKMESYGGESYQASSGYLFSSIIQRPEVSQVTFCRSNYPKLAEYESTQYGSQVDHPFKEECESYASELARLNGNNRQMWDDDLLCEQTNVLMKPWYDLREKTEEEFVLWGLRQNGIEVSSLEELPEAHDNILSNIREAISYGFDLRKGDILISSQGCNSIPYEYAELLENTLNLKRIHQG